MAEIEKPTLKELMLDEIKSIDFKSQSFASAVKWARTVIRFTKRKDNSRVDIELCMKQLDSLLFDCLNKFAVMGDVDGEELSEKDRATYVDIISSIEDIKKKYDKTQERLEKKSLLQERLKSLSNRIE